MVQQLGKRAHVVLYCIFFLFAFWVAYALVYGKGGVIERRTVVGVIVGRIGNRRGSDGK